MDNDEVIFSDKGDHDEFEVDKLKDGDLCFWVYNGGDATGSVYILAPERAIELAAALLRASGGVPGAPYIIDL